jgi:hypothetical protein
VTITQDYLDWLVAQRDDQRRQAAGVQRQQAKAEAAGMSQLAGSLGLLVMMIEKTAEHLDAEHRDCAAKFKKQRGESRARDVSKTTRQAQAAHEAAQVAELFAAAWCQGLGRVGLQAAAAELLRQREHAMQERLITAQQVGNKRLQRQHSAGLQALQRLGVLCTLHRAGKWLQQRTGKP